VVDRTEGPGGAPRDPAVVQAELGDVQVLGRVALMGGAFAVAGIGGLAAQRLPVATVFLLGAAVPLLSVLAALLLREGAEGIRAAAPRERPDPRILGGGAAFAAALLGLGLLDPPFAPEVGLLLSLGVIAWLLRRTMRGIPRETQVAMAAAAAVIFAFRAAPPAGPGLQWWQMDVLGYDQGFFGVLAQIGTGLAIAGSLLLGGGSCGRRWAGCSPGSRCSARCCRCPPSACSSACTSGPRRVSASARAPSGWWTRRSRRRWRSSG
jgi:hypothetical protein